MQIYPRRSMLLLALTLGAALAVAAFEEPPMLAQVLYGSLTGNVSDTSGAMLPGASVVVTNVAERSSHETVTNGSGRYDLPNLGPGLYSVEVSKSGFRTYKAADVQVNLGSVARLDVQMQLGAAVQSITVRSGAQALQTEQAEVRDEIGIKSLDSLPTSIGRNYQSSLRTLPGFVVAGGGAVRGSNPAAAYTVNVNGVPSELNNFRIDGASAINNFNQFVTAYVPGLDAIQSITVVSNSASADTGLAGGASVNVQIKSGTNHVHGSAFEYHTDNGLKARPAFFPAGKRLPLMIFNQFGGAIGGPIRRDKLFYFLSYDGVISRQSYSTYTTVPTDAAKAGNLSESPTPIYDPLTGNPDGSGRKAFPNNQIPVSRFSAPSQKILPLWPEPNIPGVLANNYFVSASAPYDRSTVDAKINYNATSKLILTGRLGFLDWSSYYEPVFGVALGGKAISGQQAGPANGTSINLTTAVTYVFRPNLIVDGYFGFNRSYQNVLPVDLNKKIGTEFLGIPGTNGPRPFEGGWPLISISGYTGIGVDQPYMPWIRHDPGYDYVGNINWTRKNHNLRFGAEFSRRDLNHAQPEIEGQIGGASGGFVFTNGVTQALKGPAANAANAFAAFLLGLPQSMGRTLQVPDQIQLRSNFYGLYGQDRWAVTPRLTLTYGVRWEYLPLPYRPNRGVEFYDTTNNTQLLCGYRSIPKDCGVSMSKLGFSPHLGIAFRATDTLVVRAGFAIARDPYDIGPRGVRTNYPLMIARNSQGANTYTPVGNWQSGIPPTVPPDNGDGILPVPSTVVVHAIPKDFNRGYIESRNLTLEKQLPGSFILETSYVGTLVIRQVSQIDLNAGQIPGQGIAGEPLFAKFGRTATTPDYSPMATTNYNALQVRLRRHFSHGYTMGASYTWSKAIGDNSDIEAKPPVQAMQYFRKNRAVLSYDRTNVLNITGVWSMPFGAGKPWLNRGWASMLSGGWQANGIFTLMSGRPFSVTASGTSLNMPGTTQFADQIKSTRTLGGHSPNQPWFDTTAFAPVTAARLGTSGVNELRGPGLVNLDASIFRDFPITERLHLQFRAEALNASNTPHWGNPAANISSGGFGIITATDGNYLGRSGMDERTFRLGAKLTF